MFCLACGGPCVSPDIDSMEDTYEETDDRNEKIKIKKIVNRLKKTFIAMG